MKKVIDSPAVQVVFSCVILLILGICLYHDSSVLSETVRERAAIRNSLLHSAQLISYLSNAESGQRGFLLTGESEYLTPYYEAIQSIEAQLAIMKMETISTRNPQKWREVETLINERLFFLGETLKKRRERTSSVLSVIPTSQGRLLMEKIKGHLENLQENERKHLDKLFNEYDYQIQHHSQLLALQGILIIGLGLFVWRQRKKAQTNKTGIPPLTELASNLVIATQINQKE